MATSRLNVAKHMLKVIATANNSSAQAVLVYGQSEGSVAETARTLAQMLVCTNGNQACNTCVDCVQWLNNTHARIFDATARCLTQEEYNIDVVREFIRFTSLQSASDQPGVGIMQRLDKFTTQSQNALLKLLEEPPHHCYCILTATRISMIPAPLLSRVQSVRLPDATDLVSLKNNDSDIRQLIFSNKDVALRTLAALQRNVESASIDARKSFIEACDKIELDTRIVLRHAQRTTATAAHVSRPLILLLNSLARTRKHLSFNANIQLTMSSLILSIS